MQKIIQSPISSGGAFTNLNTLQPYERWVNLRSSYTHSRGKFSYEIYNLTKISSLGTWCNVTPVSLLGLGGQVGQGDKIFISAVGDTCVSTIYYTATLRGGINKNNKNFFDNYHFFDYFHFFYYFHFFDYFHCLDYFHFFDYFHFYDYFL